MGMSTNSVRYLCDDLLIRMLFGKLHENRVDQLIQNRGCLHDFHLRAVDPCDRQKIFNHADEPFAVLLNFSQQLSCCSFSSASYLESSVEDDPYMEVRGVRRSWEIARSRLPRILSFSFSERSFS